MVWWWLWEGVWGYEMMRWNYVEGLWMILKVEGMETIPMMRAF